MCQAHGLNIILSFRIFYNFLHLLEFFSALLKEENFLETDIIRRLSVGVSFSFFPQKQSPIMMCFNPSGAGNSTSSGGISNYTLLYDRARAMQMVPLPT
jgi:hypothetical protein